MVPDALALSWVEWQFFATLTFRSERAFSGAEKIFFAWWRGAARRAHIPDEQDEETSRQRRCQPRTQGRKLGLGDLGGLMAHTGSRPAPINGGRKHVPIPRDRSLPVWLPEPRADLERGPRGNVSGGDVEPGAQPGRLKRCEHVPRPGARRGTDGLKTSYARIPTACRAHPVIGKASKRKNEPNYG